jgi:o-succinylbenzoate synthase
MYILKWIKYNLTFKQAAGTSRGVLHTKSTYFLKICDDSTPEIVGLGECNLFAGLSSDDKPDYEFVLNKVCKNVNFYVQHLDALKEWPSIRFGLEMALIDKQQGGNRLLFSTDFTKGTEGILINGLIWMGEKRFMKNQIREKLEQGFRCLKLKIGAIDFSDELELIRTVREEFSSDILELRVDANGAFEPAEALEKLKKLAVFQIHSIEQPIRQGQQREMKQLCSQSPIPIALDEELICVKGSGEKEHLLNEIRPQYLILKPALLGGFSASQEWIELAEKQDIPWWITSALESNIGLNAIAQWTYSLQSKMYQGLGTGQLYSNNVKSPLLIEKARLFYKPQSEWDLANLNFK